MTNRSLSVATAVSNLERKKKKKMAAFDISACALATAFSAKRGVRARVPCDIPILNGAMPRPPAAACK